MPDGEIAVAELGALCVRLQDLSTKVSRWAADIVGAGRGPKTVEAAALLTLSSIGSGSTVLEIRAGVPDQLDFDTPFEAEVGSQFWGIVNALGADTPPADAPTPVRESVVSLLDVLQRTAPLVEVSRDDGARVEFRPAERDRSVWIPRR
ncbi:MAG: hypothetical protein FWD11_03860, partial [Micrococcales bacterium]|nr:hypothetical protein [Micrococcales bacterium]